jgi:hypothetical protein
MRDASQGLPIWHGPGAPHLIVVSAYHLATTLTRRARFEDGRAVRLAERHGWPCKSLRPRGAHPNGGYRLNKITVRGQQIVCCSGLNPSARTPEAPASGSFAFLEELAIDGLQFAHVLGDVHRRRDALPKPAQQNWLAREALQRLAQCSRVAGRIK